LGFLKVGQLTELIGPTFVNGPQFKTTGRLWIKRRLVFGFLKVGQLTELIGSTFVNGPQFKTTGRLWIKAMF